MSQICPRFWRDCFGYLPGDGIVVYPPPPIVETLVLCFCSYLPYGRWAPNVLGYRSQVHQRCHFACGNKGSSHPCPFFYYIFSLRCKLSTLTPRQPTVIELYLQLLYPRVHAFRYESQNRRNCPVKIKLTLPSYTGRPGSSEVPRNPLTRWDVSSTPANGIFLTKILKNKIKMPNGWRTIKSFVHTIWLHGRRGKGKAESFSREKLRHAPQKEGGWKILCDLPPVWPRLVRPTNLMSRMNRKKHTHTHPIIFIFLV